MKEIGITVMLAMFSVPALVAVNPCADSFLRGQSGQRVEIGKSRVMSGPHRAAMTRSDNAKKLTRDEILGDYVYDEFRYSSGRVGWEYMYCVPEIVAGESDDEVILNGFWADYDFSYNPPLPISQVKATFDYENQTISIPAGASLGKYGDYPAYIYVSEWATDIMLDEPIVLEVNAETRSIEYWCDRIDDDFNAPVNCLLVTSYPDAVGKKIEKGVDFIGAIVMNKYNSSMEVTNVTQDMSGVVPVYIEQGEGAFTIYNFGGSGYESGLTFTVDFSEGTCTAPVTLCKVLSDGVSETEVYHASADGGEITGTVTPSDADGCYDINIPEWALYDIAAGNALVNFADGRFSVSMSTSSVSLPAVNAQGEVRYYDLMGRQVSAPSKGSVLIRVEGGVASKEVIR